MKLEAEVQAIVAELIRNGARVYLVGGFVRDFLLGEDSDDYDLEVYNLSYEKVQKILKKFGPVSVIGHFGALKIKDLNLEITLPRSESKIGHTHQDFAITVDPQMSPREAAARRDFTVNALMIELFSSELFDFYGGQVDLEKGILRHVSSKFVEDPLRVLRALRFVSKLGFTLAPETTMICQQMKSALKHLSVERINHEFDKVVLGKYFSKSVDYFRLIDNLLTPFETEKLFVDHEVCAEILLQYRYYLIFKDQLDNLSNFSHKKNFNRQIRQLVNLEFNDDKLALLKLYQANLPIELLALCFEDNYQLRFVQLTEMFKKVARLYKTYDGHYFLNRGYEPRAIKKAQEQIILKHL